MEVNTIWALVLKYIIIGIISVIFLSFTVSPGLPIATTLGIALAITVILYLVGDLLILPAYGNILASAVNAILAMIIVWVSNFFVLGNIPAGITVITGLIVGVAEWFYHRYIIKNEAPARQETAS